jgi:bacterioferritin
MKSDPRVIEHLNGYLQIELTGYQQYLLAAAMAGHWGYGALLERQSAYVREEVEHAGRILRRILFLGGTPDLATVAKVTPPPAIEAQLREDHELVSRAIAYLRDAVGVARQAGDDTSRALFEEMLVDEEEHLRWLEEQLKLIAQIGLAGYLQQQIEA